MVLNIQKTCCYKGWPVAVMICFHLTGRIKSWKTHTFYTYTVIKCFPLESGWCNYKILRVPRQVCSWTKRCMQTAGDWLPYITYSYFMSHSILKWLTNSITWCIWFSRILLINWCYGKVLITHLIITFSLMSNIEKVLMGTKII